MVLDWLQLPEDGSNAVWFSPASFWEIAIKISLGKYRLGEPLTDFMKREMTQNAFSVLNITYEHADRVARLPFHHRDPFDRLMVAQALEETFTWSAPTVLWMPTVSGAFGEARFILTFTQVRS